MSIVGGISVWGIKNSAANGVQELLLTICQVDLLLNNFPFLLLQWRRVINNFITIYDVRSIFSWRLLLTKKEEDLLLDGGGGGGDVEWFSKEANQIIKSIIGRN